MARKTFTKPTVNAGGTYTAEVGVPIQVDGSNSTTPNGVVQYYSWDWGDNSRNTVTTDPTTSHTYSEPGRYTITLTVEDSLGVTNRSSTKVTVSESESENVNRPPNAGLTVEGDFVIGGTVLAISTSEDLDGVITNSHVDWGDGSDPDESSVESAFEHIYSGAGEFTITLTVTDNDNEASTAQTTIIINVVESPTPPTAVLSHTSGTVEDTLISFSTAGSIGASLSGGSVDWGDGSTVTTWSGDPPPSLTHMFADPGQYTVVLTISDAQNRIATANLVVTIVDAPETPANVPPVAELIVTDGNEEDSPITVSVVASDSDGTLASGSINWGDGSSDDTWMGNPEDFYTHTYANAGAYTITLSVTDNDGETTTVTTQHEILTATVPSNVPPSVSLTYVSGQYVNQTITLNSSANDTDGTIASWSMNWGNGIQSGSGNPPSPMTRTYATTGNFTPTLTVTDNSGATASAQLNLTILNQPVGNQSPNLIIQKTSGTFVNENFTVSVVASDPDGTLVNGLINWGDGSANVTWTGNPAASYSHVYTSAAVRTVTVRVTDDDGASTTKTLNITVNSIPSGSEEENEYYNELIQLPEVAYNYTLRDQSQLNSLVADAVATYFTYSPSTDDYPDAQDAAKLTILPHGDTNTWNVPGKQQLRFSISSEFGSGGPIIITWDWWWTLEWRTNHGGVTGWKSWRVQNSGGAWWTLLHSLGPSGNSADPLEIARVTSGFVSVGNKPEGIESVDDAVFPSGPGTLPLLPRYDFCYPLRYGRWTRYWIEVRPFTAPEEFTDWSGAYCTGVVGAPCSLDGGTRIAGNPGDPLGRWHMVSLWVADAERGIQRILYRVPMNWRAELGKNGNVNSFDFEMNTSKRNAIGPTYAYGKNVVILHNYELPTNNPESDTTIFQLPPA